MVLSELVQKLREDILDDVSDAPDQEDEGYRWPTAQLIRYLAESQNEACRRAKLLYEETDDDVTLVTLVEGTYEYIISDKLTLITEVLLDNEPLRLTTIPQITKGVPKWRDSTNSTPRRYALNGRTLTVYPPPDATAAALECRTIGYRLPLKKLSAGNPTPEIQEALHPHLCYYAAHLAYLKRDEDTYSKGMADGMEKRFAMYFGPLYRADALAQQFEAGPDIVVVPE